MSTVGLFQFGNFTLNSGIVSGYKIDCDALKVWDWETVARWVCRLVGPFASVEGVPRGGLKLAALLAKYRTEVLYPHLIVDDVLTTGGSMERLRESARKVSGVAGGRAIVGAVLFARGPLPIWIKAVFPMPRELWVDLSGQQPIPTGPEIASQSATIDPPPAGFRDCRP